MAFGDFHLSKNNINKQKLREKVIKPPVVDQTDEQPTATANDVASKPKS